MKAYPRGSLCDSIGKEIARFYSFTWIANLRSLPTLAESRVAKNSRLAWELQMREFNIEAVRKQFEINEIRSAFSHSIRTVISENAF